MESSKIEPQKKKLNLTKLAQIRQLSQEYSVSKRATEKKITNIELKSSESSASNMFRKAVGYFTNCIKNCIKKDVSHEYTINEEEITKQVEKIRKRKKEKVQSLLPPLKNRNVKTLVLDLDQTLIYTSFKKKKQYDFSAEMQVNGKLEKIYVTKRFGLDIFLFEMSQLYEIVVYTAGSKQYTDKILSIIDLQKRISHVLYREHCTVLNGSYFLKNLSNLGRDLKKTILIDDNSMGGMLHPEVFYKIQSFHGSSHDRKLLRLIDFLKEMSFQDDTSILCQKRKDFDSRKVRVVSELKKDQVSEQSCGTSKGCLSNVGFPIEE